MKSYLIDLERSGPLPNSMLDANRLPDLFVTLCDEHAKTWANRGAVRGWTGTPSERSCAVCRVIVLRRNLVP